MTATEQWQRERMWDRLARADKLVTRCGCGEWMWRGKCRVPHDNILNFREEEK